MQTVYDLKNLMDFFTIASATTDVVIYGIGGQLDISTYAYDEDICFRFSFIPKSGKEWISGSLVDHTIRIHKKTLLGKKTIEQKYEVLPMVFEGTDFKSPRRLRYNEGIGNAQPMIYNYFNFIESVRVWVRTQTSDVVREDVYQRLDSKVYSETTREMYESLLGEINWLFLFQGFHDTEYAKGFSEAMEKFGHAEYCPISAEVNKAGSSNLLSTNDRVVRFVQENRNRILSEQRRLIGQRAGVVARRLLVKVCGEKAANQYDASQSVVIEKDNWKFKLTSSGGWITSPKGEGASMCVHTRKMDCHPIDEVVIKYLYIQSDTLKFLKTAVIHCTSGEFKKELNEYKDQLMKANIGKRKKR